VPKMYVFKKKWKRHLACAFDFLGRCITFWMSRGFRVTPDLFKKILLIRIDHMGDALLLRPALLKLRESMPEAEIHLLTTPENEPLFLLDSFIDRVIPFHGHWFQKETRFLNKIAAFFRIFIQIRQEKYSAVVDFRGDVRSNLLMAMAGVPVRLGYGATGGGWLLTHEKPWRTDRHQVLLNTDLLADFGAVSDSAQTENPHVIFPQSVEKQLLQFAPAAFSGSFAVIHAGAGNPNKEWPWESFKALAEFLLSKEKVKTVFFVGTTAEKKRVGEITPEGVIDLRGQTDIHELACLLSRADFFVGNDSGPAHLAAAQGIPIVLISSATNQIEFWHPWSNRLIVVESGSGRPADCVFVLKKIDDLLENKTSSVSFCG